MNSYKAGRGLGTAALFMLAVLAILWFFLATNVKADEPTLDWKPAITGTAILLAPIPFSDNQVPWGHGIELEGFSYAATDIIGRFLPKDFWFLAPIVIGGVDVMYRAGEDLNQDVVRRKLACDLLGVAGRVSVEIKF